MFMRSDVSNQVEASTPHILSQDKLKLFWITWPWDNDSGSAWGQITCGEGAPGENEILTYTVQTVGSWPHGPVHAVSLSSDIEPAVIEFSQFEGQCQRRQGQLILCS